MKKKIQAILLTIAQIILFIGVIASTIALSIFFYLSGVLLFVIYVYTLVHQAKSKRYKWLVFTAIFSLPSTFIYWIVRIFKK